MPFTTSKNGKIYWKLDGAPGAPGLILLNSIGTDMDIWDGLLPRLRERFCVLRLDTRGHGASGATPGDYSLAGLAADVAAVMRDADLPSAAVAGLSLGGMVAMELALARPALVDALVLICTSAAMDIASWSDRVDRVRANGLGSIADLAMARFLSPLFISDHPAIAATIRRQLLQMNPIGYAGCAAAIRDMRLVDRIAAITCRVLVVTGDRDASTPYAGHGDVLLRQMRQARRVAFDVAHLAPLEAPEALGQAMTAFLEG